MNREGLLALHQFNAQANRVVLDVAAQLDEEQFTRDFSPSHGTIRRMLIHMLGSEAFFLGVVQGAVPDMAAIEALDSLPAIRAHWEQVLTSAEQFIAGQDEAALQSTVQIRFGEHTLDMTVWQVLLQTFNHAAHHRGELSILLTELGYPLPTIDLLIHFVKASGQHWPFDEN